MKGYVKGWVLTLHQGPEKIMLGLGQSTARIREVVIEFSAPVTIGDYVEITPDQIGITFQSDKVKRINKRYERIML